MAEGQYRTRSHGTDGEKVGGCVKNDGMQVSHRAKLIYPSIGYDPSNTQPTRNPGPGLHWVRRFEKEGDLQTTTPTRVLGPVKAKPKGERKSGQSGSVPSIQCIPA